MILQTCSTSSFFSLPGIKALGGGCLFFVLATLVILGVAQKLGHIDLTTLPRSSLWIVLDKEVPHHWVMIALAQNAIISSGLVIGGMIFLLRNLKNSKTRPDNEAVVSDPIDSPKKAAEFNKIFYDSDFLGTKEFLKDPQQGLRSYSVVYLAIPIEDLIEEESRKQVKESLDKMIGYIHARWGHCMFRIQILSNDEISKLEEDVEQNLPEIFSNNNIITYKYDHWKPTTLEQLPYLKREQIDLINKTTENKQLKVNDFKKMLDELSFPEKEFKNHMNSRHRELTSIPFQSETLQ